MNRPRTNPIQTAKFRQAFTLIEVLLAVFILALGLLGLGAMVPVVIREQRQAADATLGLVVANSAQTYLLNRPDLNRWTDANNSPIGWGVWYVRTGQWSEDFAWETRPKGFTNEGTGADKADEPKLLFNVDTGRMRFQLEDNNTGTPCFIRVQDRLWPDASAGGSQPRFVWDIVGRRLPAAAGQPRQIQIAVFVRRIDPNIRVPVGVTLHQVLTQFDPGSGRALPVGVVKGGNQNASKRRPTLDGTGEYSKPFRVEVDYDPAYSSRIELYGNDAGVPLTWQLFSRSGQKLVDNNGNVYTVIAHNPDRDLNPNAAPWVEVDPPVPSWTAATEHVLPPDTDPGYVAACSTLRWIALTPQIPAAVTVFNVDVENLDQNPSGSGTGDAAP